MEYSEYKEPYEILADINDKKTSHLNYYNMLDLLLESCEKQPQDIKLQIYYILGKEYFFFNEYETSFKYLYMVYNKRDELCVPEIIEDVLLHLLILLTDSPTNVSLILYKILIKNIVPVDIEIFTTFLSKEDFSKFLKSIDLNYEKSYFFNYLFQNAKYEYCVYFLNLDYIDLYIDKLMITSFYKPNIKSELIYLYFDKGIANLNILLYLIVHDKNDKKKYIAKINSIFNEKIKIKIQIFNEKYNTRILLKMIEPLNGKLSPKSCNEEVILFLYKNREFNRILKFFEEQPVNISIDLNLINNILYFSYYKIGNILKSDEIYEDIHEIIFLVDEIEYLLSKNNITVIINKIISLKLPEDFLKALEIMYNFNNLEILKECIFVNIHKYEDVSVFKVCISYLLLFNFNLNDIIYEYLFKYDNINKISIEDKDWLFKISYNNIIDDIRNKNTIKYLDMIFKLKGDILEYVYISLIASEYCKIDIYKLFNIYKNCNKDDKDLSFNLLVLFYDYSIRNSNKDLEDEIYINLNLSNLSNKNITTLLDFCTSKNVIIEAHNRNIFTNECLERNIIFYGSKGRLYIFLRSIYIINITKYLNENIRIILKKEIDLLESYGDFKMVEFYKGIL